MLVWHLIRTSQVVLVTTRSFWVLLCRPNLAKNFIDYCGRFWKLSRCAFDFDIFHRRLFKAYIWQPVHRSIFSCCRLPFKTFTSQIFCRFWVVQSFSSSMNRSCHRAAIIFIHQQVSSCQKAEASTWKVETSKKIVFNVLHYVLGFSRTFFIFFLAFWKLPRSILGCQVASKNGTYKSFVPFFLYAKGVANALQNTATLFALHCLSKKLFWFKMITFKKFLFLFDQLEMFVGSCGLVHSMVVVA